MAPATGMPCRFEMTYTVLDGGLQLPSGARFTTSQSVCSSQYGLMMHKPGFICSRWTSSAGRTWVCTENMLSTAHIRPLCIAL